MLTSARAQQHLLPEALTPLVQPSKGLEVSGIAEGLQLLVRATSQEVNKVQSVQLELQRAVKLKQTLPVGDGPSGKKVWSWWDERRSPEGAGMEVGIQKPM